MYSLKVSILTSVRDIQKLAYCSLWCSISQGEPRGDFPVASMCSIEKVEVPFYSIRRKLIWHLILDTRTPSQNKRIHQTHDHGLLWSQSMVPNLCFRKRHPFSLITSTEGQSTIQFFHYSLSLFPVQLRAANQVNIVAKSNKFSFQWS